jgi:hypothetical protein
MLGYLAWPAPALHASVHGHPARIRSSSLGCARRETLGWETSTNENGAHKPAWPLSKQDPHWGLKEGQNPRGRGEIRPKSLVDLRDSVLATRELQDRSGPANGVA